MKTMPHPKTLGNVSGLRKQNKLFSENELELFFLSLTS